MKSSFKFMILSMLLTVLLIACNKPVYKYNKDFEGVWRTDNIYDSLLNKSVRSEIVIDGADGKFSNTCDFIDNEFCNCISSSVGKAVMNSSKTQMKIGSTSSFPLTIDEEPSVNANGIWTMKIQGLTYYRQ